MPLPETSYRLDRERLERECPAYTRFILDAGRKEPSANIEFRMKVREKCREDEEFRAVVMELCRRDILFFANTFCCVEEPRGTGSITYPFISYEFQDAFILDAFQCVGIRSHQTLKSRDTGWSWGMFGILCPHLFCFGEAPKLTVGSRKWELVDSTEDPDTIMAKFDFAMNRLPWWMKGEYDTDQPAHKKIGRRYNPTTRCVINGAATTEDFGRGGRRTAIFIDEFAFWDVNEGHAAISAITFNTDSVIVGSTPNGDIGAYRDRWFNDEIQQVRVELKWEDHPRYREGMYTSDSGNLVIIDDEFWNTQKVRRVVKNEVVEYGKDEYPFVLDGRVRSPLYDLKFSELGPMLCAQELDRDFLGSGSPFFDTNLLRKLEAEHAQDPVCRLHLEVDFETGDLVDWKESADGLLYLWRKPLEGVAWPVEDRFYIGCDVASGSAGEYASNATIEVFDAIAGEQVAELASATIDPADLACYAAALGQWFNNAVIAFEKDGHGLAFLKKIFRQLNYSPLYYPRKAEREAGVKLARSPGWAPRPETKLDAFNEFAAAQANGRLIIRSKQFYAEQRQFVHDGKKGVAHRRAKGMEDRAEGRHKHGDRVSGGVIAWKCHEETPVRPVTERPKVVKPGTLQWWLDKYDENDRRSERSRFMPSGQQYRSRIGTKNRRSVPARP
jgi:hypothetical protein